MKLFFLKKLAKVIKTRNFLNEFMEFFFVNEIEIRIIIPVFVKFFTISLHTTQGTLGFLTELFIGS